jgi:hypothetical protein
VFSILASSISWRLSKYFSTDQPVNANAMSQWLDDAMLDDVW